MATAVDFVCPHCSADCTCHSRPGEMVRCPHCFSFITVPEGDVAQYKVTADEAATHVPLIVFRCPYCQSRIETDSANAGLACLCPGCHAGITIPGNAHPIFVRSPDATFSNPPARHVEPLPTRVIVVLSAVVLAVFVAILSWLRS